MKNILYPRNLSLALLLLCTAAIGCSSGSSLDTADVSGTFRMDGQPLPDVVVRFYSPNGGGGGFKTSTDGSFESPMPIKIGAYDVVLVAPTASPGMGAPTTGPLAKVPPHFWSIQASGLKAEVTAGGPNQFDFDISSSEKPPAGFRAPRSSGKGPVAPAPVNTAE